MSRRFLSLRENVLHMDWIHSGVCSCAPRRHQWLSAVSARYLVWGRSKGGSGGRSETGIKTSFFLTPISLGWVYCCELEVGSRRKGIKEKERLGSLSYYNVWLSLCLFVCPHTVEINLPSVELWTQRARGFQLDWLRRNSKQPGHTSTLQHQKQTPESANFTWSDYEMQCDEGFYSAPNEKC